MKEQNRSGRKPKDSINLGNKMKEEREKRKLTQEQIAEIIGINYKTYGKYETGETKISAIDLMKLAKYYNVSTDYLLGISDVSSADPDDRAICERFGLKQKDFDLLVNAFNNREEIADAVIEIRELMKSAEYLRDMLSFENASRRENEKRVSA